MGGSVTFNVSRLVSQTATSVFFKISMLGLALLVSACSAPGADQVAASTQKTSSTNGGSTTPLTSDNGGGGTTTTTATYTRGEVYGLCEQQLDDQFRAVYAATMRAPMATCTMPGKPTCAAGFVMVAESFAQMNTSPTSDPTKFSAGYWQVSKCLKLAGADANNNHVVGKSYGQCERMLNAGFIPTYAAAPLAPMTGCPMSGSPTCEEGFEAVPEVLTQLNSTTNSAVFVPIYRQVWRCMKK